MARGAKTIKLWWESACSTSTNTSGVVWVWNRLKIEDKASGRQAPLGKMAQSKLYHYAVNFEKFQHPEPYHLCWQHVVRNNSLWIIFDCLTGENCSNKNGLGHIVCHYSWHIRSTGSFSLDDKFWVQHQHKGCFPSSKGLKLCTWKLKTANDLKRRMRLHNAWRLCFRILCIDSTSCYVRCQNTEQIWFATQMWFNGFQNSFQTHFTKPQFKKWKTTVFPRVHWQWDADCDWNGLFVELLFGNIN